MHDTDAVIVYMIIFVLTGRVIYIGSTYRGKQRSTEHLQFSGGAPRVAIAFAQSRFQPRKIFFRFEVAWSGVCTIDELHAIEQYFIDKYKTRVYPRPTNSVTMDIDLMRCDEPVQLNINNASTRTDLFLWAASRVQCDSAMIAYGANALDALLVQQRIDIVAHEMNRLSESTSYAIIQRAYTKYAATFRDVSVTEFHADLNDVNKTYTEDDGQELKDNLRFLLQHFNKDKRMAADPYYRIRSYTVANHFRTLLCTLDPNAFIGSTVSVSQPDPPMAKQNYNGMKRQRNRCETSRVPFYKKMEKARCEKSVSASMHKLKFDRFKGRYGTVVALGANSDETHYYYTKEGYVVVLPINEKVLKEGIATRFAVMLRKQKKKKLENRIAFPDQSDLHYIGVYVSPPSQASDGAEGFPVS